MREIPARLLGRVVLAPVLLATFLLAGCGGPDDAGATGEPLAPKTSLPTAPAEPLWNPCDAFSDRRVEKQVGVSFTSQRGTPDAPTCTFTPVVEGGPAIDVNYNLVTGSLDDLFATFGQLTEGADTEVSTPTVPRADDARLVVDVNDDDNTLTITGFVQNGDLVQLVNVLDPAPYDLLGAAAGVTKLLGDLSVHAAEAGLNAGVTTGPTSSPTTAGP